MVYIILLLKLDLDIDAGGETGVLVDAFNTMLTTIQQRDAELVVAKNNAEQARERERAQTNLLAAPQQSNTETEISINETPQAAD